MDWCGENCGKGPGSEAGMTRRGNIFWSFEDGGFVAGVVFLGDGFWEKRATGLAIYTGGYMLSPKNVGRNCYEKACAGTGEGWFDD